jgi:hypothetical protein
MINPIRLLLLADSVLSHCLTLKGGETGATSTSRCRSLSQMPTETGATSETEPGQKPAFTNISPTKKADSKLPLSFSVQKHLDCNLECNLVAISKLGADENNGNSRWNSFVDCASSTSSRVWRGCFS